MLLLALFWVLDSGVAQAISREVARALEGTGGLAPMRSVLRSVEVCAFGAGIAVVVLAFAAGDGIVDRWLRIEHLEWSSAYLAFRLLGIQLAFRFFLSPYRAVISGAQELVWLNGISAGFATLRGVGVIPLLQAWPTIETFIAFQAGVTALEAGILRWKAWSLLPDAVRPAFSWSALGQIHRFSFAAMLVTLLCFILSQADRAVLSAMISLSEFGAYTLSASVASVLGMMSGPVSIVAQLKFNELAARGEGSLLSEPLHKFARVVVLGCAPAALVLAVFAEPLLFIWTRNATLSAAAAPLLIPLTFAALFNACAAIPYVLPLAHGRPGHLVRVHAVAVALLLPAIYFGSSAFGAIAAAIACASVAAFELLVAVWMLHADVPPAEVRRWFGRDVILPIVAAGLAAVLVRSAAPSGATGLAIAGWIVGAYLASLAATAMTVPSVRDLWQSSLPQEPRSLA